MFYEPIGMTCSVAYFDDNSGLQIRRDYSEQHPAREELKFFEDEWFMEMFL